MVNKFIRKIIQLGGVDVKRYNKALIGYANLFQKYRDFTMIPKDVFVGNLELCSQFLAVNGDIVECGVWKGGMSAAIAEVAGPGKRIHLFDSFEGLPPAKEIDGVAALTWQTNTASPEYYDNCAANESFAIEAMRRTGNTNYQLYKGWFHDTLSSYEGQPISILRLDGDWYDSVKSCLNALFPLVTEGGLIIIDDYHAWDGCTKAVHDHLSESKSSSRIHQWNNQIAYIIKKS